MSQYRAPRTQRQRTDGLEGDYPTDWPLIALAVKEKAGAIRGQSVGIIPESGPAELYLINVSPLEEWEALWSYYPAQTGRRGGRRLIKEEGKTNAQHDEARV